MNLSLMMENVALVYMLNVQASFAVQDWIGMDNALNEPLELDNNRRYDTYQVIGIQTPQIGFVALLRLRRAIVFGC